MVKAASRRVAPVGSSKKSRPKKGNNVATSGSRVSFAGDVDNVGEASNDDQVTFPGIDESAVEENYHLDNMDDNRNDAPPEDNSNEGVGAASSETSASEPKTSIATKRPPPRRRPVASTKRPRKPPSVTKPTQPLWNETPVSTATAPAAASTNVTAVEQQESNPHQLPQCPNCGGHAIEQHEASGASVCTDCGVVVEENAIVSSVEFVEGAGGSSSMVGQFVSATSSKAYTGNSAGIRGGGRYGFSRDSRETTLANGRRRIQELASRLRLGSHFVDGAHRLFTVAVERNFVQGRRTTHVVAACLYIACRQEKSQHMLIDFSDALQVNVYTLGTCFLKFRRLLGLKLEIIDPALYVYRFAAHLDLDDRANAVSLTSLRLVARMKRDWIVAGRRPAGICAAALLIAARAHGFDKHCADVTRILRVCGMTVTSRVREFERTPAAHLSLEQFQTVDFEAEADPPIYTKNKIREARAKAIQQGNVHLLTSGVLDDQGKRGSKWRTGKQKQASERTVKFQELYLTLEQKLDEDVPMNEKNEDQQDNGKVVEEGPKFGDAAGLQVVVHQRKGDADEPGILTEWKEVYPKIRGRDMIMPDEATVEERLAPSVPTEAKLNLSEWKQHLPIEIDQEIEDFFRTEDEVMQKEAIFNKINKDYIALQERKENERMNAEAATKDQDADDMAQAAGQARYKDARSNASKSKRHSHRDAGADMTAAVTATTEEQLRAAVLARKVSRKINYDALSSIFDEDGSFATDGAPEEPVDDDELMFETTL
jgi:transcription factor IIIB 90 kDa subunit